LQCPRCHSDDIQTRQKNHRRCFHRYYCRACGRWFSDVTGTFLEASNVSLARWVYLIRETDKKRSIRTRGERGAGKRAYGPHTGSFAARAGHLRHRQTAGRFLDRARQ
jgi:transposase-like protein